MTARLLRLLVALALASSIAGVIPATALAAPVVTITTPVGGQRTNDTTPLVAGTGGTSADDASSITLDVYSGTDTSAPPVRSFVVALSGGNWSLADAAWHAGNPPLAEGDYTLIATQASGTGSGTASVAFTVDLTAPVAAVTGPASPINDRTPTLTGSAGTAPGDGPVQINVYAGASLVRSLTVSGSSWAAPLGLIADGDYTATATQSDNAGNSSASGPFAFTVAAGPARIAFVANPANNADVYSQFLDGTSRVNLTNNVAIEESPSFSADGLKMVFTSTRDGQREIYVRDVVSGTDTRVTTTATHEFDPAISADGTKIAFWRSTGSDTQVFVIDVDGTDEYPIPRPESVFNDQHPSWSPDGTKLVVSSLVASPFSYDLMTVNADGTGRQSVFLASGSGLIDETEPAWSPDGTRIAYRQVPRGASGSVGELRIIAVTGATSSQNLATGGWVADPAWSSDSAHIVFVGSSQGNANDHVQLIDADGTGRSDIPTGSGIPRQPVWQPAAPASATPPVSITFPTGGQLTNDTTPPFAGTAGDRPGDEATVNVAVYAGTDTSASPVRSFAVTRTGTDWAVAGSAWTATGGPLADGGYTVVAQQGSASGTGQASTSFAIDTTAPSAAVTGPASPIVDRTPKLTGTAGTAAGDQAFVTLRVYAGSVATGTPVKTTFAGVGAAGTFIAPVGLLNDGDYVATAAQSDAAGNTSTSGAFAFSVAAGSARIAVVRNPGNNHDVFSQRLDGTGQINLTNNVALEEAPSFTADGTVMVFSSTRDGQREIYHRDMTTGVVTRLTTTPEHEFDPVISPDGTKIAFWRNTGFDTRTFVIDADGSGEIEIPRPDAIVNDQQPSWSPDSTQLVLASRYFVAGNESYDLTIVNADGTGRHNVFLASSSPVIDEIEPAWSPDGTRIAYRQVPRGASGSIGELHVIALTGATQSQHLATGGWVSDPAWSDDSEHLLFVGSSPGNTNDHLQLIDADGTGQSDVPSGSGIPRQPVWQPLAAGVGPVVTLTFPSGDERTSDTTPAFAGAAGDDPGDAATVNVDVYAGTDTNVPPIRHFAVTRTGTSWQVAQGAWDAGVPERAPLAEGHYTVVASQVGANGTGRATNAFFVDVTAPAPELTGPSSPIADRTPKLTGTAGNAPGDSFAEVRVYAGTTVAGSPVKSVFVSGGPFLAAVGFLPDGEYVATVRQSDSAGNTGVSTPFPFTIGAGPARLAVVRNVANNRDIYRSDLDGSGLLNLTNHIALEEAPSFSADGSQMLFVSDRDGQRDIYVRDMTTGDVTQLTDTAAHEFDPVFSPDGTRIAFWRPFSLDTRAYVMDADGDNELEIPRPGSIVNDQHPSWSPDGTHLVLASRYFEAGNESYDLTIVDPDDPTGARQLAAAGHSPIIDELEPAWSPAGNEIAFRMVPRGQSGGVGQLHVVDLTTHESRFIGTGSFITDPAWSPDAAHIVFAGLTPAGQDLIQLVDADGTGLSTVAVGPGLPSQPVWIPEPTEPPAPALTLVKTATLNGPNVDYSFTITNSGNVSLHGIGLDDDLLGWDDEPCGVADLAPGGSTSCSASYPISQADRDAGSVSNSATACAADGVTCASDETTTPLAQAPALTLAKTATPTTYVAVGDVITYTYALTNSGNVTLRGPFIVTDDKLANPVSCGTAATTIAPGASFSGSCTAVYSIQPGDVNASGTGSVTNHATATATTSQGTPVTSNQAEATVRQVARTARITHTGTSCADFRSGRASDLETLSYNVQRGKVNSVSPGVLFYYSSIVAPAPTFTVTVTQSNSHGWAAMPVQSTNQIILYDASCSKSAAQRNTTYSAGTGLATIQVSGATAGATYVIGIKYAPSDLGGQPVSSPFPTVTYTLTTAIGGTAIASSADSAKLVPK